MERRDSGLNKAEFNTNLYSYSPFFDREQHYDYFGNVTKTNGIYYSLVIAEKGIKKSELIKYPTNLHFIASSAGDDWTLRESEFVLRDRPIIGSKFGFIDGKKLNSFLPHNTNHYRFIGSGF